MEFKNITLLEDFNSTITQEQIDQFGYLQWDNETLGRAVKSFSRKMYETDMKGWEAVKCMAAIHTLIACVMDANAATLRVEVGGFTNKNYPDEGKQEWSIWVQRMDEPQAEGETKK